MLDQQCNNRGREETETLILTGSCGIILMVHERKEESQNWKTELMTFSQQNEKLNANPVIDIPVQLYTGVTCALSSTPGQCSSLHAKMSAPYHVKCTTIFFSFFFKVRVVHPSILLNQNGRVFSFFCQIQCPPEVFFFFLGMQNIDLNFSSVPNHWSINPCLPLFGWPCSSQRHIYAILNVTMSEAASFWSAYQGLSGKEWMKAATTIKFASKIHHGCIKCEVYGSILKKNFWESQTDQPAFKTPCVSESVFFFSAKFCAAT